MRWKLGGFAEAYLVRTRHSARTNCLKQLIAWKTYFASPDAVGIAAAAARAFASIASNSARDKNLPCRTTAAILAVFAISAVGSPSSSTKSARYPGEMRPDFAR